MDQTQAMVTDDQQQVTASAAPAADAGVAVQASVVAAAPAAASSSDDMQLDDGADGGETSLTVSAAQGDLSVEERRMQDTAVVSASPVSGPEAASNSSLGASSPTASPPAAAADATTTAPGASPSAATVATDASIGAPSPAAGAGESESAAAAKAAEEKRRAARVPLLYRMSCTRCQAVLQFPYPTRLVHCAVCSHVNAVTLSRAVDHVAHPPPDKELREQAAQWSPMQVVVFLKSLKLEHLTHIFENNQVDGQQLLDLTYYDVRDILRIHKSGDSYVAASKCQAAGLNGLCLTCCLTHLVACCSLASPSCFRPADIENVLNCVAILRGNPVPTPNDLLSVEEETLPIKAEPSAAIVATPTPATETTPSPTQPTIVSSSPAPPQVAAAQLTPAASVTTAAASSPIAGLAYPAPASISSSTMPFAGGAVPVPITPAVAAPVTVAAVAAPPQLPPTLAQSPPGTGVDSLDAASVVSLPPSSSSGAFAMGVAPSPQGSIASMAHFAPATEGGAAAEGTTDHARAVLHLAPQQTQAPSHTQP